MINKYGRVIPKKNLSAECIEKSRRYFVCEKQNIDESKIFHNISDFLQKPSELSLKDFLNKVINIKIEIDKSNDFKNLLSGPFYPFFIPKLDIEDIGRTFKEYFLPAVKKSYEAKFPKQEFINHTNDEIIGNIHVTPQSRHANFLSKLKQNDLVGIFFPAFSEYSINATLESIKEFPNSFSISGAFDVAAAFIGTPNILIRNEGYAPLIGMGGVSDKSKEKFFHFEPYGYDLTFNKRVHLNKAAEYWHYGVTIFM